MGIKFSKSFKSRFAKAAFDSGNTEQFIKDIKKDYFTQLSNTVPTAILDELNKGNSPVQKGKYKKTYSKSYLDQIDKIYSKENNKARLPVNLKLTGKLHKSLKATPELDALKLVFEDDKAKYHDIEGAGKSKVIRRMLPKSGESFNKRIAKIIVETLNSVLKKFVR